jgi:hypothetical protein
MNQDAVRLWSFNRESRYLPIHLQDTQNFYYRSKFDIYISEAVVENYPKFKVLDYWKMNPTDFQTYLE